MAFGISGANIFAGTNYSHGVFLSTNNGTNWTAFNNPAILATDVRALVIKETLLHGYKQKNVEKRVLTQIS